MFSLQGANKTSLWEFALDDVLTLLAQLPLIAATIYSNLFRRRKSIPPIEMDLDWAGNFARQLGVEVDEQPEIADLLRLYLIIHCDHEGGNVSAHSTHLVGSALADPFTALAAGKIEG